MLVSRVTMSVCLSNTLLSQACREHAISNLPHYSSNSIQKNFFKKKTLSSNLKQTFLALDYFSLSCMIDFFLSLCPLNISKYHTGPSLCQDNKTFEIEMWQYRHITHYATFFMFLHHFTLLTLVGRKYFYVVLLFTTKESNLK